MSLLSPATLPYLEQIVDLDNLYVIAHYMLSWESVSPQLGLDYVDVEDIKHDHSTAEEQRFDFCILCEESGF